VPIYDAEPPSWSSCKYSSTPNIISIEEKVLYPCKIDIAISRMSDVQERKLARTKTISTLETIPELNRPWAYDRRIFSK